MGLEGISEMIQSISLFDPNFEKKYDLLRVPQTACAHLRLHRPPLLERSSSRCKGCR